MADFELRVFNKLLRGEKEVSTVGEADLVKRGALSQHGFDQATKETAVALLRYVCLNADEPKIMEAARKALAELKEKGPSAPIKQMAGACLSDCERLSVGSSAAEPPSINTGPVGSRAPATPHITGGSDPCLYRDVPGFFSHLIHWYSGESAAKKTLSPERITEFDREHMDILFLVAYPEAPYDQRPQRPCFICFGEVTAKQSLEAVFLLQKHGLSDNDKDVKMAALRYLTSLSMAKLEGVSVAAREALIGFCLENQNEENRIWCPSPG